MRLLKENKKARYSLIFLLLGLGMFLALCAAVLIGTTRIAFIDAVKAIFGGGEFSDIKRKALLCQNGKAGRTDLSAVPPAFGTMPALVLLCNGGGPPAPTGDDPFGAEAQEGLLRCFTGPYTSRSLSWHQRIGYYISVIAFLGIISVLTYFVKPSGLGFL